MEEKNNKKNIILLAIVLLIFVLSIVFIIIMATSKQKNIEIKAKEAVEEQKDKIEEVVEKLQDENLEQEENLDDIDINDENDNNKREILYYSEFNNESCIKNFTNSLVNTTEKKDLYYDDWDTRFTWTNFLPQININDEKINNINKQIRKIYNEVNDEGYVSLTYNAYLNDNILSLVVCEESIIHLIPVYYTYNIDINTKEILSRDDILKFKNMSENDFNLKIEKLAKEVKDEYNLAEVDEDKPEINEYVSYNNEIFLDENGNINVCLVLVGDLGTDNIAREYFYVK